MLLGRVGNIFDWWGPLTHSLGPTTSNIQMRSLQLQPWWLANWLVKRKSIALFVIGRVKILVDLIGKVGLWAKLEFLPYLGNLEPNPLANI